MDAAATKALANAQFGSGGGTRLAVDDLQSAMADGRLTYRGMHEFNPETLTAKIEDPRFSHADPTLPERPLDPGREEVRGRISGGADEAAGTAGSTIITTGAAAALDQIEQGAR